MAPRPCGAHSRRVGDALQWWTYFDNPWEVMAYGIANPTGRTGQGEEDGGWLCWPWAVAIIFAIPVVGGLGVLFVLLFVNAYR